MWTLNVLKQKSQSAPSRPINKANGQLWFEIKIFRCSANLISVRALYPRLNWHRGKLTPTLRDFTSGLFLVALVRCVILSFLLQRGRSISARVSRLYRVSRLSRSFFTLFPRSGTCSTRGWYSIYTHGKKQRTRRGCSPRWLVRLRRAGVIYRRVLRVVAKNHRDSVTLSSTRIYGMFKPL